MATPWIGGAARRLDANGRMGQSRAPRSRPCGGGLTASRRRSRCAGWRTSPSTSTGSGARRRSRWCCSTGSASARGRRAPHRHDYHELIWIRAGARRAPPRRRAGARAAGHGDRRSAAARCTCSGGRRTVARRRAALRRRAAARGAAGGSPRLAAGGRGGRTIARAAGRPAGARRRSFDALAGGGRAGRPTRTPRTSSAISWRPLLLWLERWYDGGARGAARRRRRRRPAAPALRRRGSRRTSPPTTTPPTTRTRSPCPRAALARALARLTGRTTKELVLDRVMLEAARLLRFTDLDGRARSRTASASTTRSTSRARSSAATGGRRSPTASRAARRSAATAEVHASARPAMVRGRGRRHWLHHESRHRTPTPRRRPGDAARRAARSAPSTSPSPTSTAPSPGTRSRSGCASTAATRAPPSSATARDDVLVLARGPAARARRPPRRALPLRAALPDARGARPRRAAPRRRRARRSRAPRTTARTRRSTSPTPTATASSSPPTARASSWPSCEEQFARRPAAARLRRRCWRTVAGEEPGPRGRRRACASGHLHLHVGDIDAGLALLPRRARLRRHGGHAAPRRFVSAGGYHHHLGFNVWRGRGRAARAARTPSGCATGRRAAAAADVAAVRGRARGRRRAGRGPPEAASSSATRGRSPLRRHDARRRTSWTRPAGAGRRPSTRRRAADRPRRHASATCTCARPTSTACATSTSASSGFDVVAEARDVPGWGTTGDILFVVGRRLPPPPRLQHLEVGGRPAAARRRRRAAPRRASTTRRARRWPTPCGACARSDWPLRQASDHGTHLAIYISDPDGNDLELAWDRPFEEWPRHGGGRAARSTRRSSWTTLLAAR